MKKYVPAALALLAVVPASVVLAAPANADVEKRIRCQGAVVELSVDREDGRYEVELDIDGARRGSTWGVVLRHDGTAYTRVVRTADRDGEVDVDRVRPNRAGKDKFGVTVTHRASGVRCSTAVTVG